MCCSVCGSTDYKEGKRCSKLGQTVCIDCCEACEYYLKDDVYKMHRCIYGVKEFEEIKNKIGNIKKRIRELDKQQADLYRTGYVRKAEDSVWKIVELKRSLKKLEDSIA